MMSVDATQIKFCIGLTGGIGCGKTTVAELFRECGAYIVDTDDIAHQLTQPQGAAIVEIRKAFGERYITADGAMNRPKMRELIFSDSLAKQKLEALLHPMIRERAIAQMRHAAHAPYVIFVVPLLLQSPVFLELVQRILVVDCDESLQVERVMRRSQLNEMEVLAIMKNQIGRERQLEVADDVIHNDGNLNALKSQVIALHEFYFLQGD